MKPQRLISLILSVGIILTPACNALDGLFGGDETPATKVPADAVAYQGYDAGGVLAASGWLTLGAPGDPTRPGRFHIEATGQGIPTGQPIGDGTVFNVTPQPSIPEIFELNLQYPGVWLVSHYVLLHGELDHGTWECFQAGERVAQGTFVLKPRR